MRAVARDADASSDRAVNMWCFAFVRVAFAGGAIGLGRDDAVEIKSATFEAMTFFTGQGARIFVYIKAFESFGDFALIRAGRRIKDFRGVFGFAVINDDGVQAVCKGNHGSECASFYRDTTFPFDCDALNVHLLDGFIGSAGQEKGLFRNPCGVRRGNYLEACCVSRCWEGKR